MNRFNKGSQIFSGDGYWGLLERSFVFLKKQFWTTYYRFRFAKFGRGSVVTGPLSLRGGRRIEVGEAVVIQGGSEFRVGASGKIHIGHGTFIEKGSRLFAKGKIFLGEKTYLLKDTYLNSDGKITLGNRSWVGAGSSISGEDVVLEENVILGPSVFVLDADHRIDSDGKILMEAGVRRPVRIQVNAWLGARAIVLKGVTVGEGAVVGAGAVVTRDVPMRTVVGGSPAQPLKKILT